MNDFHHTDLVLLSVDGQKTSQTRRLLLLFQQDQEEMRKILLTASVDAAAVPAKENG